MNYLDQALKKWDETKSNFSEVIALISSNTLKKVAAEFEVTTSIISRWESGIAVPHVDTQASVVEFIKKNK